MGVESADEISQLEEDEIVFEQKAKRQNLMRCGQSNDILEPKEYFGYLHDGDSRYEYDQMELCADSKEQNTQPTPDGHKSFTYSQTNSKFNQPKTATKPAKKEHSLPKKAPPTVGSNNKRVPFRGGTQIRVSNNFQAKYKEKSPISSQAAAPLTSLKNGTQKRTQAKRSLPPQIDSSKNESSQNGNRPLAKTQSKLIRIIIFRDSFFKE